MPRKKSVKVSSITTSGKRKTAVAKATIFPGTGIIRINKKPISHLSFLRRLMIEEPIRLTTELLKKEPDYNIFVNVTGGGVESQIEASRLAIARALMAFTKKPELRNAFLAYDRNLLVADVRRKEQYKPNDSKARAARQKSYR